jgi:hypothetical protein
MKKILRLKNKADVKLPPVEDVPILIPAPALAAIKDNEASPYEIIEAIPFPSEGQGGIYTGKYFESLLNQIKERPLGGSKTGHENERDDFFTVGGKVEYTSENEGVCYLRIMIPEQGYETTNSGFIRSCKTGNQEFSVVANVEPVRGNDGVVYFVEDTGKARNDAVSEGAMDQTVSNGAKESEIMELISIGKVDLTTDSDQLVHNGTVYRRAAVKLQSSADYKAMAGRVLNAIGKQYKEKNAMTKAEIFEAVRIAVANNELTLEELAQAVNMQNKLRNATDEQRQKLIAAIAEILGLPPESPADEMIKAVEDALKDAESAAEAVADAEANSLSGGKKIRNADGTEDDNPVYLYVKNQLAGKRGEKLKNAVKSLATDPVALALRSKQADPRTTTANPFNLGTSNRFREV